MLPSSIVRWTCSLLDIAARTRGPSAVRSIDGSLDTARHLCSLSEVKAKGQGQEQGQGQGKGQGQRQRKGLEFIFFRAYLLDWHFMSA